MNGTNPESQLFEFQSVIKFIKRYWLIIAGSVMLFLGFAYVINKISKKKYLVSTSIVINEESSGMANTSAQLLKDMGIVSSTKNFANEVFILKSSPLIKKSLENMDLQISYYEHMFFTEKEMYKNSPFVVFLDKNYPQPIGVEFFVEILDKDKFTIYVKSKEVAIFSFVSNVIIEELPSLEFEKTLSFDSFLVSDMMRFKLLFNSTLDIQDLKGKTFSFRINTEKGLINSFKSKLDVMPPDLESSIAEIRLSTNNVEKAKDFLNNLTSSYIKNELERKRFSSITTIEYINNQLSIVGDSLENAERSLQSFRSQNEVADLSVQSDKLYDELRQLENKKAIMEVNQKYYDYVLDYFNKNEDFEKLIAPSAMGIDDPMLNNLIEELIKLNAERASFIGNNQAKSPYLKKIDIRIENIRKMVSENISYYKKTNSIAIEDVDSRISKLDVEIRKLPTAQRILVGIQRKFNINDGIYTYLLEKRAEAEIAKASYQADSEIVEPAEMVGIGPIYPNKKINYFIAIILGLLIPIVVLRIKEMLRTSFFDVLEMENSVKLPILGKVYNNKEKLDNVIFEAPNSYLAENFRHLRVGLKYFLQGEKCKTISFSSTISGEGKSFIAKNTALAISNSGKKVAFINFDLRKPFKYKSKQESVVGLTEYLSKQAAIRDIIRTSEFDGVDIIYPGSKAPNPAELITSDQVPLLFSYLKEKYEYIIVDTPPIGLLSDAFVLSEFADLNVFIVRRDKTPKGDFEIIQNEIVKKKIKSCVVLNDLNLAYKNKYGANYYV